ncbi:MAG: aldo/keto reductase [Halolamina sp.]|uniref:aldo/keto reductase n=1 Tax=Halolamina sp. TaxID=1940283 RepID=UPI002FC38AF8
MDCVFVGAGAVASAYAEGVPASALRLTAVCDRVHERAASLAGGQPDEPAVYTDLDAMLAAESAPLAVNLTSHGAHAEVTERCLEADRHVFSEKPLALDADRAAGLVEMAETRSLALGCAPINDRCDAQRHAKAFVDDGRLGEIGFATATANVGRVDQWHDRPESFLQVGPLYDGAVYPLSLLVAWFGRVATVRRADAIDAWPGDEPPAGLPHVEATLEFADGPVVALRASFYVDHRSREFYGLELHGDDGTLYVRDTGSLEADRDTVTLRGGDRESTVAPHPQPRRERSYIEGPERLAETVDRGATSRQSARRAAHVVAVCNAIECAAETAGSIVVDAETGVPAPRERTPAVSAPPSRPDRGAIRLPPVGFGCSRYRDGRYVEPALGTALDAGYRLFDTAELYGNEWRLGELLDGPGAPARESLFLIGKPWRTNHGADELQAACESSLDELGVETFDCYALHWPGAWEHQGTLTELSKQPVAAQERLTFPTDTDGTPRQADHGLVESWRRLERVHERGLARTLGISNVTLPQLARLVDAANVPPALVQIERHPYQPRERLVDWCHRRGIRVVAHSPLSAPGLLDESVVETVAQELGVTPATTVLAWNVTRGVVPIPSTTDAAHVVSNLAAARHRVDEEAYDRLTGLRDPEFAR